jgi:autotransporter-associated beta strand protein
MRLTVLIVLAAVLVPAIAGAQSGSWITSTTGTYHWGDAGNWQSGTVADGANNTATFATAGLTGSVTVKLDTVRTIGSLVFDNPSNAYGWTIQGFTTLTLSNSAGPAVAVNNTAITAVISAPLAGSFTKGGPGTLVLTGSNTGLTGGVTVAAGTLAANPGSLGTSTVTMAGGTLVVGPGSVSTGFDGGVGWTANGNAVFGPNSLQLTNDAGSASSAWFNNPIPTSGPFTLKFTLTNASSSSADGITVGFQKVGVHALGAGGGGLGWSGISPSVALDMNIFSSNTTGGGSGVKWMFNGNVANPVPTTAPVNFGAQNKPTNVIITYDGANAELVLIQGVNVYDTGPVPINFGSVVGSSAYFGFTGGSGGIGSQLSLSNASFSGPGFTTQIVPGTYPNNVVVTSSSTIQVAATPLASAVTMGSLSFATPSANLIVTADPGTVANQQFNLTFGAISLNGPTTLSVVNNGAAGPGTLTLGVVADGASAGSLIKSGSGTLMLPAASTYTGGTTVSGGVLMGANASGSATGTGPVIVAAGGTLRGGGGGGSANPFADSTKAFVGGPVTVQAGGILYPGVNQAGLLTLGGGITFQSDAIWQLFLTTENPRAGPQPADENTNTRVVTPLDILFGGTLHLWIDGALQTYSAGTDYDFYIGRDDGVAAALPTSVAFLPFDFLPPANIADFSLTRSADGRDLILTYAPVVVPEVGTFALIAAASLGLTRFVRRRGFARPPKPPNR